MILRLCLAVALVAAAPMFRYERLVQMTQSSAPETCVVLPLPPVHPQRPIPRRPRP